MDGPAQNTDDLLGIDWRTLEKPKRPIYRTVEEAQGDITDVRRVFTSQTNPALKVRPYRFWSAVKQRDNLDNLRPIVTALQANRFVQYLQSSGNKLYKTIDFEDISFQLPKFKKDMLTG